MSEELTSDQKIDRIYVAFTHPDTGFDALNRRVGALESWRTGLSVASGVIFAGIGAGFQYVLARMGRH